MANETTTLPSSAYALVSLTRNLGTPTSDLRATSPSNYQQPSSCFWAILDDQLKLLFIDPTLPNTHQQQLTLNQLIPPNDYQNIKSKLPQQQQQHQSTIIGHPQSSIRTPIRCNFLRHTHLIRLLTTTESNSTQSDDRHQPTDLILHPIPHGRFLAFFHSQQQQQQQQQVPNPPYSPWITNFHPCGLKQSDNNHYLNQDQVYQLQRALTQSQSPPPPNFPLEPTPLEIFLIIDSRTARVLFSHHYSILTDHHHHHQFSPEDYAYFAMQSKSLETQNNNNHEHTNCSRQLTAQHQLVKDGMVINIVQSFVIEYGNLTFASFKSTPTSRPQTMSNQQQSIIKPSPLELVHDHSHPIPLDLYSPTSSQLAHKRPRTDSCSEVLTPQSACSTHSQSYPYNQPPSAHHQYSTSSFNTNNNNNNNNPHHHHHHHHHHHPSPQLSSLTSTISIPESPDAYGYTHFSGELSPTMASAANVLGSFHRAHYHQPQSILALQNPAPTPSTNLIGGYESYGLQNLASMATSSAPFEPPPPLPPPPPPPPQPDFSSSSNSSSPLHSEFNPFSFSSSKDSSTRLPPPSLNPPSSSSSSSHSIGLNNHRQQHPSDDELCSYPPQPLHSLDSHPHHHHLHHHHSSTRLPYLDKPHTLKRPRSAILDPPPNKPTPSLERNHPAGGTTTTASATTTTATVRACTSCGAQNSPEWRKGPNGVKSLCNACGLRFSRAQARKSKAPKPANKKLHSQYPPPSTPLALQSLSPQSSAPGPTLMAKKKIGFAAGTPTPSSGSLNDHTHHSVDRSINSPASSFVVADPVGGPSDSSIVDRFSR